MPAGGKQNVCYVCSYSLNDGANLSSILIYSTKNLPCKINPAGGYVKLKLGGIPAILY
jgi:hypothetical protein